MDHIVLTSMPDGELSARWNSSLEGMPLATHYLTPNYFNDPYVRGKRFAVLAVEDDGQIVAIMTGTFDDAKVVSGMFSRPQMIFREGIDRGQAAGMLLKGVDDLANPTLIDLHSWQEISEFVDRGVQMRTSGLETSVVVLDLTKGSDSIFAGFSQTRRNEIRRAIKQGVVEIKELETEEELAELYLIHCSWNALKGNQTDTFENMQTAAAQRENRRIFIAKTDGKVIAGSFYRFCPGGMVEYAANFSLPEFQKLRPNDLIGWHAIEWAGAAGCRYFSMGGSHLFLRRFGGEVWTTYRYTRDNRSLSLNAIKQNVREVGAAAFRRLPTNVRAGVRRVLAK